MVIGAKEIFRNGIGSSRTRNSATRYYFGGLAHYTALAVHKTFPDFTPNEMSALGTIEDLVGVYLAEEGNLNSSVLLQALGFGLQTSGKLKDGLDGALARIIVAESPWKHDTFWGGIADVTCDRGGEIGAAWIRARSAYLQGNFTGEYAAEGVAMTSTLPSLTRAGAETLGYPVPEMGSNLLQAFGTRFGRMFTGMAATHVPFALNRLADSRIAQMVPFLPSIAHKGSELSQVTFDGLTVAANLYTASARLAILRDPNAKPVLNVRQREEALTRFGVLIGIEFVSILGTVLVHKLLREVYPENNNRLFYQATIIKTGNIGNKTSPCRLAGSF